MRLSKNPATRHTLIVAALLAGCGKSEEAAKDLTVVAERVAASTVPTIDQIAPYDEALSVGEYRVRRVIDGPRDAPETGDLIRVAHWTVVAGKNQPALEQAPNRPREMKLTPLAILPGLDKIYRRDDLPVRSEATLYLDLSQSLATAETPKQVRYDYRGRISPRMKIYWLTRRQLRLIAIGNSHTGVGVDTRRFFQPENQRAPLALNLSAAGSELPLQRLLIETYLLDLPNLEWVVWGISPRIFNQNHALDRRAEIFRASPGFAYDQSHHDKLWPVNPTEPLALADSIEDAVDHEIEPWGWSPAAHRDFPVPITTEAEKRILSACRHDNFRWNAEAWESFTQAVDAVTARGIRLLLFTPPYHPLVRRGEATDFNGTGHEDYRNLVRRLDELAGANDGVVFLDVHRDGTHDFLHEDFANADHLSESGAQKLTAMLVETVESASVSQGSAEHRE